MFLTILQVLSFFAVSFLAGCGDGGGNSSAPSTADQIVATYDDLKLCTANREGSIAYVRDEDAEYVCTGGNWGPAMRLSSEDGSSAQGGSLQMSSESNINSGVSSGNKSSSSQEGDENVCNSDNVGEVKTFPITQDYDYYVICKNGQWNVASVIEYDTYGLVAERDGAIKKGNVTDAKYKYDSLQGEWLDANWLDTALGLNGCTRKRETEVGRGNNVTWYICRSGQWQAATTFEYDTYQKTCSNNAELISGAVVEANKYVCDAGSFRVATESEKTCGRGCTSYNLGEKKLVGGYMQCFSSGVWSVGRTVSGTLTDTRDGNRRYATIGIGTQTWMAENLNYDYKINGVTYGSYCYNNSADSCAKYGRLYTWGAAVDSAITRCGYGRCNADTGWVQQVQGVCPNGWHLPSQEEWQTLFTAVGGQSTAGTALKATSGWYAYGNDNGNGKDKFGFSALPSGKRNDGGTYMDVVNRAFFWSSSGASSVRAYSMSLYYRNASADLSHYGRHNSFAVRCVKD